VGIDVSVMKKMTKVQGERLAKRLKGYNEVIYEDLTRKLVVYYDYIAREYRLTPDITHFNLDLYSVGAIGELSWQEVMDRTGRNSVKEGGSYIYHWVSVQLARIADGEDPIERVTQDGNVGIPCCRGILSYGFGCR